jgi:hypothetical protein
MQEPGARIRDSKLIPRPDVTDQLVIARSPRRSNLISGEFGFTQRNEIAASLADSLLAMTERDGTGSINLGPELDTGDSDFWILTPDS